MRHDPLPSMCVEIVYNTADLGVHTARNVNLHPIQLSIHIQKAIQQMSQQMSQQMRRGK
jgi:hypothetical protein